MCMVFVVVTLRWRNPRVVVVTTNMVLFLTVVLFIWLPRRLGRGCIHVMYRLF